MPVVDGVKLTDEQAGFLAAYVAIWGDTPVEEWGVPAQICKAVYDALPAENEQP